MRAWRRHEKAVYKWSRHQTHPRNATVGGGWEKRGGAATRHNGSEAMEKLLWWATGRRRQAEMVLSPASTCPLPKAGNRPTGERATAARYTTVMPILVRACSARKQPACKEVWQERFSGAHGGAGSIVGRWEEREKRERQ